MPNSEESTNNDVYIVRERQQLLFPLLRESAWIHNNLWGAIRNILWTRIYNSFRPFESRNKWNCAINREGSGAIWGGEGCYRESLSLLHSIILSAFHYHFDYSNRRYTIVPSFMFSLNSLSHNRIKKHNASAFYRFVMNINANKCALCVT